MQDGRDGQDGRMGGIGGIGRMARKVLSVPFQPVQPFLRFLPYLFGSIAGTYSPRSTKPLSCHDGPLVPGTSVRTLKMWPSG